MAEDGSFLIIVSLYEQFQNHNITKPNHNILHPVHVVLYFGPDNQPGLAWPTHQQQSNQGFAHLRHKSTQALNSESLNEWFALTATFNLLYLLLGFIFWSRFLSRSFSQKNYSSRYPFYDLYCDVLFRLAAK